MKTTNFFYTIVLTVMLMISCNEDKCISGEDNDCDAITNVNGEDNDCDGVCDKVAFNTIEAFFEENEVPTQVFAINVNDGAVIRGTQGTIITIPADAFVDKAGNVVTGDITIKVKEIFNASDMILSNRPTNAINNLGESTFLLSEGETEIIAEQNGNELSVASGKTLEISVPVTTNDFDLAMRPFTGVIDADDNIVWEQNMEVELTFSNTLPYSYIYNVLGTGWSNCDKFYNYAGDKTTNYVDLSSSPNSTESRVFIVFKEEGLPAVVGFTQQYADGVQSYINSLPVGLEVTFIGLTINDNQQYLATKEVVIAEDEVITLDFLAVSTAEITTALTLLD